MLMTTEPQNKTWDLVTSWDFLWRRWKQISKSDNSEHNVQMTMSLPQQVINLLVHLLWNLKNLEKMKGHNMDIDFLSSVLRSDAVPFPWYDQKHRILQ